MTTEAETLTTAEEEAVLELIVRNQLKIKELTEQNDTLKAYYKQSDTAYPAGTYREVGKFYVRVSENTRIDDTLAKSVLKPSVYERVSKRVIDTKRAAAILDEESKQKIRKVFDNKIEVGLK